MANIVDELLELAADIKMGDKEIEATPVGQTGQLDVPPFAFPLRLKGNKKIKITAVIFEREQ